MFQLINRLIFNYLQDLIYKRVHLYIVIYASYHYKLINKIN